MNDLKDLVAGLPGNILANLISTAIAAAFALILGLKGRNPQAKANLSIDQNTGQVVYAPENSGTIDSTYIDQSQKQTITTVIKNYGSQSGPSRSNDDPWLYGILGFIGIGILLWASRFLPFITPVPLYMGGAVAVIVAATLIIRRTSFTTVALRKAALAIIGLATSSVLATLTMAQAQNLENPYSLLSIAHWAQNAAGTDKILSGALPRALHLMRLGNQEYMYAFLLGAFTIILSWLVLVYYLRLALGSLLFPLSSNGYQFTGLLGSLNTGFVKSSWYGMVVMVLLAFLMTWIASAEGITHIFQWATTAGSWIKEAIKTL